MKTALLAIIAACQLASTVAVYEADTGGINIFFGQYGYHIAKGE